MICRPPVGGMRPDRLRPPLRHGSQGCGLRAVLGEISFGMDQSVPAAQAAHHGETVVDEGRASGDEHAVI